MEGKSLMHWISLLLIAAPVIFYAASGLAKILSRVKAPEPPGSRFANRCAQIMQHFRFTNLTPEKAPVADVPPRYGYLGGVKRKTH
jgi:hypothetical protein